MDNAPRSSPLLSGIALLIAGVFVRRLKPSFLELPEHDGSGSNDRGMSRAARKSRDGVARVLPSNLTASIGRTLIIMGAGLILVRALDELVEDEDALF